RTSTRVLPRLLRGLAIAFLFAVSLATPPKAQAQLLAQLKIAPDLLTTIGSSTLPIVPGAKLLNGEVLVRALVVSNSDDRTLKDLRRYIVSIGGSVSYNYVSIRA